MCVCIRFSLYLVRFGQLLRCAHKRIVNIMKVCIERNNIQVELIRFRKKIVTFIAVGNFEVGIYFATDVLIAIRDESPLFCSGGPGVPDVSAHDHFGTRHFGTYSIQYIVTSGHAQFGP